MSSLLLTDTPAAGRRVRVSRGGRRVVVPLAEYRASRAGHPVARRSARGDGHADGAGHATGVDGAQHAVGGQHAAGTQQDVAAGPRVAPEGDRPLRLTRRGRVVVRVLAGAALLLVVAVGVLADRPALAGQGGADTPVAERVVLPGETLWAIAGEVAPGTDRRETVAQIIDINDLPSAEVTAGQRLAVPTSTR